MKKVTTPYGVLDVVTAELYYSKDASFDPNNTAVEFSDGKIIPVKPVRDNGSCILSSNGLFGIVNINKDESYDVIDFNSFDSFQSINDALKSIENIKNKNLLNSSGNTTDFLINENDTPVLKLLKTSLNQKNICMSDYANYFGPNYPNDVRIVKGNNNKISLDKLGVYLDIMNLKADLLIYDGDKDQPNKMNCTVSATDIFGGDNSVITINKNEEE